MDVIASVIVAALVNWNDTVEVTGPPGRAGFDSFRGFADELPSLSAVRGDARGPPGWITIRVSFRFTRAATITATITSTGAVHALLSQIVRELVPNRQTTTSTGLGRSTIR